MSERLPRRLARRLPAYHSGLLSDRERRAVDRALAAHPAWQAASEQVRQIVALLRAHDPAAPVDPRAVERMMPALRAALAAQQRAPRAPLLPRLAPAGALAAMLFASGLLCGAQLFPRTVEVQKPVTVERRVEVPVEKIVRVPVERVVHVPVERVVTRWRTRTVYRDRVRGGGTTGQPPAAAIRPEVITIVTAPPQGAAGTVPASVQF